MNKHSDVVSRLMARKRLAWVPPEAMREAILAYITLVAEGLTKGTWPPLNSQFLVDPESGAFAMAPPLSGFQSSLYSSIALVTGVNTQDMVWQQIVTGVAVCIRLWLDEVTCDAKGNEVASSDLHVLDVDALYRGWEEIRPVSKWKRKTKPLTTEKMADSMSDLVRSLSVVPLKDKKCLHKANVNVWANVLKQQWRLYRRGTQPATALVLSSPFQSEG